MKVLKHCAFFLLALPLFMSCGGQSELEQKYADQRYASAESQGQIDQNLILDYFIENDIDAERTKNGVYYVLETEGEGNGPGKTDVVTVHYEGRLMDGTVFDSSYKRGEPTSFPLNFVVAGWQEAIPLLKPGGKGTFYIPSTLAYKDKPAGGGKIPANSVLVFDVELISVFDKAAQAKKDEDIIQAYIKENKLDAKPVGKGVYVVIDEPGKGDKPTLDNKVTCHYEGTLIDGKKFDSSFDRGQPTSFPLRGVVPGWQVGIPAFAKGGKGTILVPSEAGYGINGAPPSIPPNSVLKFKVELIDFE